MNYNVGLSLFRVFPITERTSFRFNRDTFNALNIHGYNNPSGTGGAERHSNDARIFVETRSCMWYERADLKGWPIAAVLEDFGRYAATWSDPETRELDRAETLFLTQDPDGMLVFEEGKETSSKPRLVEKPVEFCGVEDASARRTVLTRAVPQSFGNRIAGQELMLGPVNTFGDSDRSRHSEFLGARSEPPISWFDVRQRKWGLCSLPPSCVARTTNQSTHLLD